MGGSTYIRGFVNVRVALGWRAWSVASSSATAPEVLPLTDMRSILLLGAACCLLPATACSEGSPSAPTVPLSQEFTLAPRQPVVVRDTSVQLAFFPVSGDSRCPAGSFCIQGGDAIVQRRATIGGSIDYELHTGDHARAVVSHAPIRIELVQLQPYPFSGSQIDPDAYRATFLVTR